MLVELLFITRKNFLNYNEQNKKTAESLRLMFLQIGLL
jgi:hypothetical protein